MSARRKSDTAPLRVGSALLGVGLLLHTDGADSLAFKGDQPTAPPPVPLAKVRQAIPLPGFGAGHAAAHHAFARAHESLAGQTGLHTETGAPGTDKVRLLATSAVSSLGLHEAITTAPSRPVHHDIAKDDTAKRDVRAALPASPVGSSRLEPVRIIAPPQVAELAAGRRVDALPSVVPAQPQSTAPQFVTAPVRNLATSEASAKPVASAGEAVMAVSAPVDRAAPAQAITPRPDRLTAPAPVFGTGAGGTHPVVDPVPATPAFVAPVPAIVAPGVARGAPLSRDSILASLPESEYVAALRGIPKAGRHDPVASTAYNSWDIAGVTFAGYPPQVVSGVDNALASLQAQAAVAGADATALAQAMPATALTGRTVSPANAAPAAGNNGSRVAKLAAPERMAKALTPSAAAPRLAPVAVSAVMASPAAAATVGHAPSSARLAVPVPALSVLDQPAAQAAKPLAGKALVAEAAARLAVSTHALRHRQVAAAMQAGAGQADAGQPGSGPADSVRLAAASSKPSVQRRPMRSLPEPAFGRGGRASAASTSSDRSAAKAIGSGGDPEPERTAAGAPASDRTKQTRALDAPVARETPAHDKAFAPGAPLFGYDDELVLEIRTAQGTSADTIIAYGTRSGVYLPLGALTRFLDLAIKISDDGHYASGWFLDEKRTLAVNLRQGRIDAGGRQRDLAPGEAAAFDGELYLRADVFADLLPLRLKPNLRDQAVDIVTLEPFPFEQRLAREAERERLASLKKAQAPQRWPRERTPWSLASVPVADVEMRAASDSTQGTRYEEDMRLAGDLAFMTAQAYASVTSRDGLTAARLQLGRRDPDGHLLGPLRATEFQIGDVSSMPMTLGLRGTAGRGVFVGNVPVEAASVFDNVDLRGALPDGYEVELYRNAILVASTRNAINGQYEFLAVPVEYGLNILRLVFYGPQGQRYEEVRRLSVGDGRLAPGQVVYSVSALQKDASLFKAHGPDFTPGQDYGAWRSQAQLGWGLSRAVTAIGGVAWFDSDRGRNWLGTAGLRTGVAGLAGRLDLGFERDGARVFDVGLGGRALGLSFTADHAEYSGAFIDETRGVANDPLRAATALELTGALVLGKGPRPFTLPLAARFSELDHRDGRRERTATVRTSLMLGRMMLSPSFDYTGTSAPGTRSNNQLLANFDLASLSGSRTQFRAAATYRVLPAAKLVSAGVEIDHRIDDRTTIAGTLSHGFDSHLTQVGVSAIRRFPRFTVALDGNVGVPGGTYSAVLRLGLSFGRNPLDGRLFAAPPGLATAGSAALLAYRDTNGNRTFDPGEAPLSGVTFTSGAQTAVTDKRGLAFLGPLGSGTRTSVQMDVDALPDIALAPATRGIELVPRPGRIHVARFAIDELSEIDGTARFESTGRRREVSGLQLQLVDDKGAIAAKTRSEGDGFFLFEQVRPGHYTVRIDPQQEQRFGLTLAHPVPVEVGAHAVTLHKDLVVRNAAGASQ